MLHIDSADGTKKYAIRNKHLFANIIFVQECLKRWAEPGDKFVLRYAPKTKNDDDNNAVENSEEYIDNNSDSIIDDDEEIEYRYPDYSLKLLNSKNIILRGAPGTGKTYLARQIAADIVSNGKYWDLSPEEQQKCEQRIKFVQFHPSYDYTDFVEGLRPTVDETENDNKDSSIGFELRTGIFKEFIGQAKDNCENAKKSPEERQQIAIMERAFNDFISDYFDIIDDENFDNKKDAEKIHFKTVKGTKFVISGVEGDTIFINVLDNEKHNIVKLKKKELVRMLASNVMFDRVKDVHKFYNTISQRNSYYFILYREIKQRLGSKENISIESAPNIEPDKYVFIIDEINRGEISKIFGELFFSIDPGYRGPAGKVKTQYANLHDDSEEDFYIPDNVYIIGTMNDIDRSVDSFDFAMRRRFRFIEIKVIEPSNKEKPDGEYNISENTDKILGKLEDANNIEKAKRRIINLNMMISNTPGLNANYHIGAAYFLKLNDDGVTFDVLWDDFLEPLLQEYVRGMSDEDTIIKKFKEAYNKTSTNKNEEKNPRDDSQNNGNSGENASGVSGSVPNPNI